MRSVRLQITTVRTRSGAAAGDGSSGRVLAICRNAMRPPAPRAVASGITTHWDQRWTVTVHGDADDGLQLTSMRASEWRSLLDGNQHLQRLLRGVETKLLVGWPVLRRRRPSSPAGLHGNRTAGALVGYSDDGVAVQPLHEVRASCGFVAHRCNPHTSTAPLHPPVLCLRCSCRRSCAWPRACTL